MATKKPDTDITEPKTKQDTAPKEDNPQLQNIEDIEKYMQTEEENTREFYKEQAKNLGLSFPVNITTEKLKQAIANKINSMKLHGDKAKNLAAKQFDEMKALVRIRIHVLNPIKQNWTGEIFTVGNDLIPHQTRFIPFNAVNGIWHVERIFVDMLRNRKYQVMVEHSNAGVNSDPRKYGVDFSRNKLVPEFLIEELPPLTQQELEELASGQASNHSIQED